MIAMHVAASNPPAINKEDIDKKIVIKNSKYYCRNNNSENLWKWQIKF